MWYVTLWSVLRLSLLVLVLPAHGRVGLLLTPAPGRHDCALRRRMGLGDETFARGDMCDHAIHKAVVCSLTIPDVTAGSKVKKGAHSAAPLPSTDRWLP